MFTLSPVTLSFISGIGKHMCHGLFVSLSRIHQCKAITFCEFLSWIVCICNYQLLLSISFITAWKLKILLLYVKLRLCVDVILVFLQLKYNHIWKKNRHYDTFLLPVSKKLIIFINKYRFTLLWYRNQFYRFRECYPFILSRLQWLNTRQYILSYLSYTEYGLELNVKQIYFQFVKKKKQNDSGRFFNFIKF